MDVFISWSGNRSRVIAEGLRDWLPTVLGMVRPWISSEDIDKGARWAGEIARQLLESKAGIFCLTPENLESRWLNFEAGAISNHHRETSHVCTYLYDLTPTGVGQPLSQFQPTVANKEDTKKMLFDINRISEQPVVENALQRTFYAMWPDFEKVLVEVALLEIAVVLKPREPIEVLEEIASGVKSLLGRRIPVSTRLGRSIPVPTVTTGASIFGIIPWQCPDCNSVIATNSTVCPSCGYIKQDVDEDSDST